MGESGKPQVCAADASRLVTDLVVAIQLRRCRGITKYPSRSDRAVRTGHPPGLLQRLGDLYLDNLNKAHFTRNLVHRLERLGYTVMLERKVA